MQLPPQLDGLAFDVLPLCENRWSAPELDNGWGEIAEALVVTPGV